MKSKVKYLEKVRELAINSSLKVQQGEDPVRDLEFCVKSANIYNLLPNIDVATSSPDAGVAIGSASLVSDFLPPIADKYLSLCANI